MQLCWDIKTNLANHKHLNSVCKEIIYFQILNKWSTLRLINCKTLILGVFQHNLYEKDINGKQKIVNHTNSE